MAPVTTRPIRPLVHQTHRDLDSAVEPLLHELALEHDADRRAQLVERVVLVALPLADAVARRYRGRGIETDDLFQVARTALVKAVHRYRLGAGPGFAAFAAPTITGEVKRWFRDQGWAVRPPRRVQELRAGVAAAEEAIRHRVGREPADCELADVLGVPVEDVVETRLCSAGYHAASLDAVTPAGFRLADHLLVTDGHADAVDVRDALRRSLAQLDERDRLVLRLRFVEELTQSEIGERIGVSQMQVSRILHRVLGHLRTQLFADDVTRPCHSAA